jgi:hypothetical protein
MKVNILLIGCFFSLNIMYSQSMLNDTIKISRLSDNQVKEMIQRCWPNVKDTLYYGEYYQGIKYGYSQYETFLDSNNSEFGPILIMKSEMNTKMLSYEITEQQTVLSHEIYQLVSPYQMLLNEHKIIKNGTVISNRIEKTGDFYTSTFNDGRSVKVDSLLNFEYSLNEDWAQYLFDLDTISKMNTVLKSTNNMNFEDYSYYTIQTQLIKREKKLINGIEHIYTTTKVKDNSDETGTNIIDEYLTIVESNYGDDSHRSESKDIAMNFEANQDMFFNCIIPVDIDFCQIVPRYDSLLFTLVLFEFEGDQNPFDSTLNQRVYPENGKLYLEINTNYSYVSKANKQEIADNLKETNFYPINDTLIIKMAKEATKGALTKKKKVDMLIKYVHNYIKYSKDDYSQHFISVYDIIRTKNGVCSDFAELYTVLARSIGIPCRTVGGYALDPNEGYLGGHAWNEVEIEGKWYGVDPTWGLWLPSHYHFKESNTDMSCKEISGTLLKLKSITFKNGKTVKYN